MTEAREAPEECEPQPVGYVREGEICGGPIWILFDGDGREVLVTDNRSSVFFHAAAIDMKIVLRH